MRIHFAALVGVDYDLDLVKYWTRYYLDRNFDSYTVFLHRENGKIHDTEKLLFDEEGFDVRTVGGSFSDGKLRRCMLMNFCVNLPRGDFIVTADADEFQALPDGSPLPYRDFSLQYDIISGLLEDRYSDKPEACRMNPFLQYNRIEEYTGEYFKEIHPPWLGASRWPVGTRTKICMSRVEIPVAFVGSHYVEEVPQKAEIFSDCRIVHFAWREGAARKLAVKSYCTPENLKEIFHNNVPDGLLETLAHKKALLTDNNFLFTPELKGVLENVPIN